MSEGCHGVAVTVGWVATCDIGEGAVALWGAWPVVWAALVGDAVEWH